MGITKDQLTSAVTKVKAYVDKEVASVEVKETTYTDEEVNNAIDAALAASAASGTE